MEKVVYLIRQHHRAALSLTFVKFCKREHISWERKRKGIYLNKNSDSVHNSLKVEVGLIAHQEYRIKPEPRQGRETLHGTGTHERLVTWEQVMLPLLSLNFPSKRKHPVTLVIELRSWHKQGGYDGYDRSGQGKKDHFWLTESTGHHSRGLELWPQELEAAGHLESIFGELSPWGDVGRCPGCLLLCIHSGSRSPAHGWCWLTHSGPSHLSSSKLHNLSQAWPEACLLSHSRPRPVSLTVISAHNHRGTLILPTSLNFTVYSVHLLSFFQQRNGALTHFRCCPPLPVGFNEKHFSEAWTFSCLQN